MARFDIYNTLSRSGVAIKNLSVYNPLSIRKKGTRVKAIFALGMVCFLWGTTWIGSREGVRHMPAASSLQMAGIRQFIGGFFYVIFFLVRGTTLPKGKEWIPIVVLSFLNFMISNGLATWGVKYITAGLASIIGSIFPLWLVIIGLFTTSGRIPLKAILGLLLGFAGVCIIFYDHLNDFLNPEFRLGILFSLIATWTWAIGTIYTKKHAVNYNPYFSLGLQMLISGFVLMTFTEVTGNAVPLLKIPWQTWLAISYLVIFGSFIGFIAYLYALQNLPTAQASIYAYINPVVAVLLGWMIFDERLTIFIGIGGAVTLYGVYLVNQAYKQQ